MLSQFAPGKLVIRYYFAIAPVIPAATYLYLNTSKLYQSGPASGELAIMLNKKIYGGLGFINPPFVLRALSKI